MAVEVLLMADVTDLGSEGEIVSVSDGYARNYLFPKDLAAVATEATKRRLEKIRRERESALEAEIAEARTLAEKLAQVSCTISVKANEEDKMFGSIGRQEIVSSLAAQGYEFDKEAVELDDPIKELGVYDVQMRVHPAVECTIKVWIVEE